MPHTFGRIRVGQSCHYTASCYQVPGQYSPQTEFIGFYSPITDQEIVGKPSHFLTSESLLPEKTHFWPNQEKYSPR